MESYKKALSQLNPEQRQAAETIDGPLLVVAGPGTGKTQLLSLRVAYILQNTDTAPQNILCLTFTNKAALNMRERLLDLIGPESQGVQIKTFHSFGAEIIDLYPEHFWNNAQLSSMPDGLQYKIVGEVLSSLPLDNPLALKFNGQFTLVKEVAESIGLAKQAGLTPARLRQIIACNLDYVEQIEPTLQELLTPALSMKRLDTILETIQELPAQNIDDDIFPITPYDVSLKQSFEQAYWQAHEDGKTTAVGVWKKRWVQSQNGAKGMFDERRRNQWWLALSDVYETYRQTLHERGYYDFSDMIIEVITQLAQNSELRADVQERFLYVMIDEFQDTNEAQLRLAHLVADHPTAEGRPNIMAVGDDDQSIFKFQGAELNNMLNFRRQYRDTSTVVLKENYRSHQSVLDAAAQVITRANFRLVNQTEGLSKDLLAKSKVKPGELQHRLYPDPAYQYSDMANLIEARRRSAPDESIVVLARKHASLRQLSALLLEKKLAIRYEKESNALEHPLTSQFIILAKLVEAIGSGDNNQVNALLHRSLRHPMWQIPALTLWELALENNRKPQWLNSLLDHKEPSLQQIGSWLTGLVPAIEGEPLAVALEHLIGLRELEGFTSPLRSFHSNDKQPSYELIEALSAVRLLRELTSTFSDQAQPSLTDFVDFIETSQANQAVISNDSPFVKGQGTPVELMTIHKAKGLEFDTVIVLDAVEPHWQAAKNGRKPPANLPLRPALDDWDDYVRLMYVALTRAKSSIIVGSWSQDAAGKEVMATPIISGALPEETLPAESLGQPQEILEQTLRWPELSNTELSDLLRPRLDSYSLSVTHLLKFLDFSRPESGPEYFVEKVLLRLPEVQTPHTAYGSAIHRSLQFAQKLVAEDKLAIPEVIKQFELTLKGQAITNAELERYSQQGRQLLEKLFDKDSAFVIPKNSQAEVVVKDLRIGPATVNGAFDRLDIDTNKAVIVDYKTGAAPQNLTASGKSGVKSWTHRTQLIFYAMLLKNSTQYNKVDEVLGQMIYLESIGEPKFIQTYSPTPDEIERMEKLVAAVWRCITELKFPSVDGYSPDGEGILQFEDDLLSGKI